MNAKKIFIGGSRDCISSEAIEGVVSAALDEGFDLRTGCALGADSLVIRSALALNAAKRLEIFAAFSPSGDNAAAISSADLVFDAYRLGSRVSFSSFSGPLRARLAARSRSAVVGVSRAAWFLTSPACQFSGSYKAACFAARSGVPVWFFSLGFSAPPPPLDGVPGFFLRDLLFGFPAWFYFSPLSRSK